MPKSLMEQIKLFQEKSDNFMDILDFFNCKIKYLSYKLKYPEAYTDLIIYLYELLTKLDLDRFKCDEELLKYIRACLKNKSINLYYKIKVPNELIVTSSHEKIANLLNRNHLVDEYSNIIFKNLIFLLKPNERRIIFLKFYLQLSDIEIAKK
ncbi:RNA polymerase subunit sigma-24, partial [Clostridium sp. VAP23]